MRVTQSMLSNNMLRNLSNSYAAMGKLQEQVNTGKKVNRPSDDPVTAMKGINYRAELNNVEQFARNIGEAHNWLDTTDDTYDKIGSALQRANELMVNASSGTTTEDDRKKIDSELQQLREHVQNLANTKIGDRYIFSGTKTTTAPFDGEKYVEDEAFNKTIEIEVFSGIMMPINSTPIDMFKDIDAMFEEINTAIQSDTPASELSKHISTIDKNMNKLLETRAGIGARQNRVELMDTRLQSQEVIATKRMSENEDIDYEKTITQMITQESIHRAALSVGARIIQPTLTDFLR
ncbi:flagellar hook-associated protein 3 FlgL [Solibacillus kalamii]|uniref:Flagellar hook-associated protein FlgL n=1 Tax=Solibacillus kalamii TaxID=1748298 RepID=A0ABX3ZME6_9BACL|nr:flagellar hook-associated protein FlgL [Solibacillus kalamii]MBM7664863.1 flagellar hook-associated protein 3 FlgL [Solibacillus kalamii]OUZ40764.1 flagellar hook-associated protein FlgL [Solibacillus kalamii]